MRCSGVDVAYNVESGFKILFVGAAGVGGQEGHRGSKIGWVLVASHVRQLTRYWYASRRWMKSFLSPFMVAKGMELMGQPNRLNTDLL